MNWLFSDSKAARAVLLVIVVVVVLGISFGGWLVRKEINYSFNYQDKVKEEIALAVAPYEKRISALEAEIASIKKTINERKEK